VTHSNHRLGSPEALLRDWVVFNTDARQLDPRKHERYMEILAAHNPVCLACRRIERDKTTRYRYVKGWEWARDAAILPYSTLIEIGDLRDVKWGSAVYVDPNDVKSVVAELKEADLGISVVVSGLFSGVRSACEAAGIEPHTVNMSAGTYGHLELLPEGRILEITSMCGHHMVSPYLVAHMAREVRARHLTLSEASVELARQCTCNFFNVERCEGLLATITEGYPTLHASRTVK
jgi:hypothetical protein